MWTLVRRLITIMNLSACLQRQPVLPDISLSVFPPFRTAKYFVSFLISFLIYFLAGGCRTRVQSASKQLFPRPYFFKCAAREEAIRAFVRRFIAIMNMPAHFTAPGGFTGHLLFKNSSRLFHSGASEGLQLAA